MSKLIKNKNSEVITIAKEIENKILSLDLYTVSNTKLKKYASDVSNFKKSFRSFNSKFSKDLNNEFNQKEEPISHEVIILDELEHIKSEINVIQGNINDIITYSKSLDKNNPTINKIQNILKNWNLFKNSL